MKKTNKTFKRFAAITSASLLAACAVAPVAFNAFAAPSTIEIINADDATHTYEAYQIFAGKISGENKVLTQIVWGTNVDATKLVDNPDYDADSNSDVPQKIDIYKALMYANEDYIKGYNYSIPEGQTDLQTAYDAWVAGNELEDDSVNAYYAALKEADENDVNLKNFKETPVPYDTAEAIADVLATYDNESAEAYQFADIVAKYLTGDGTASHKVTEEEAVDKDEANGVAGGTYAAYEKDDIIIPDLADGYYLIQDTTSSPGSTVSGENSGAKTRFILKVTDDTTQPINAKASAPTVMKKVQEDSLTAGNTGTVDFAGNDEYNPGTGYNDVADYAIGDEVPFKLYGTMPSTLDDYDHYYYKFTDTLGDEFEVPQNVKVYVVNEDDRIEIESAFEGSEGSIHNYECKTTGNDFTIEFKDIKNIVSDANGTKIDIDENTIIEVEYTAKLSANAKIGYEGQLNKVDLTYSNNPNQEYNPWDDSTTNDTPDTGTTKEDGVIVFTYGFDINKYTGQKTNKLADAKFAAYYYGADGTTKNYLVVEDGLFTGETVATPTESTNSVWTSSTSGNIEIKGLDIGTYYITEIKAPDGYNPLNSDIEVVVASSKSNGAIYTQNWTFSEGANFAYNEETGAKIAGQYSALDAIKLTYNSETITVPDAEQAANEEEGIVWAELEDLGTVDIENKAGTQLPGTGGIGTTIFYLGGGAMAAIGGIYLISKRRMRKSEE